MANIRLVNNGIFPITRDKIGEPIMVRPNTALNVAGTVQGEGKLVGVPSLFVRLSGCNLRCAWEMPDGSVSICDTPYSSFDAREFEIWNTNDIVQTLAANIGRIEHVVLTGGEPLIQAESLTELAEKIKNTLGVHITIETNGTMFNEKLCQWIDLFSISPKLRDSVPHPYKLARISRTLHETRHVVQEKLRRNIEVLQQYINLCRATGKDFQLKFVVTRPENAGEIISDYLQHLQNVQPSDIVLMPAGATLDELIRTTYIALEIAIANGWRFTPRLQVDLFGNKPGT